MTRAVSVLTCVMLGLGGCKHETPESRVKELLPVNESRSEQIDGSKGPTGNPTRRLTPDRIHGGII